MQANDLLVRSIASCDRELGVKFEWKLKVGYRKPFTLKFCVFLSLTPIKK